MYSLKKGLKNLPPVFSVKSSFNLIYLHINIVPFELFLSSIMQDRWFCLRLLIHVDRHLFQHLWQKNDLCSVESYMYLCQKIVSWVERSGKLSSRNSMPHFTPKLRSIVITCTKLGLPTFFNGGYFFTPVTGRECREMRTTEL